MANYEDKIVILIEAVDKTNKILADLQKKFGGVKQEALSFGKLLGGITLGDQLSRAIVSIKDHIISAASATLKWSGDMETFGLSITSSLVTGGKYIDQTTGKALKTAESFGIAREAAKGILQELQAANLQTIATLDQLARVYVETLPIALQKGFNTKQVKEFTLATVQAAGAIGLEMDMIAEETRAMLTPSINPRFSRVAVALGLTNEDIRQHSQNAETLFSFLMQKLEGFRLAGELTQRTWKGLWSNLKDIGLQAGGAAIEPLFLSIKGAIEGVLAGVVRVNEETKKIEWNPSFLAVIENVRSALEATLGLMGQISSFGGKITGGTSVQNEIDKRAGKDTTTWFDKISPFLRLMPGIGPLLNIGTIKNKLFGLGNLTDEQLATAQEFENTQRGVKARTGYEKLRKPDVSDQYSAMLNMAGTAFNLDPNFIKSVMMAESAGQAGAVSPKGALGLMQIMPQNIDEFLAKVIAKVPAIGERVKGFPSKDVAAMDPLTNIMMGAMYLRENFSKQGVGNIDDTLAAYNMGPGKFAKFQKNAWGLPEETQKYISKVQGNYAKYGGTDLFSEQQLAYQGNEQMSKSDIEMAKANYDAKLKLADNYTKTQTQMLDSGAKLQLAVLEANYAAGYVAEEDYYDKKNEITQSKLQKELELIDKQSNDIYQAFKEGMMSNITQPSEEAELGVFRGIFGDPADVEREKEKATGKMADLAAKRQSIMDEMAISDAQEEQRKSQIALKILEINNREAESYEKTSNSIITDIEKIKVKYNEMLPGDALIAEHEREIKALENHIKHLAEEIEKTPLGGVAWTKKMDDIVNSNVALTALRGKTPYVTKEAGFVTDAQKLQNIATQLQAEGQIAELNADMETLAKVQLDQTVNSLREMAEKLKAIGDTDGAAKLIEMVNVLQSRGSGAFAGIVDGLNEVTKSIGSTQTQFSRLTSGVGQEMRSSLSGGIYDWFKGNINWNKSGDLGNVEGQIAANNAQRGALQLQKDKISGNNALSESEKQVQQDALDAQLKQVDAYQALLNAQKQAIENSKSGEEILQGFLDRVTAKLADFMADSIVEDFMGFLTGKSPKGGGSKEGGVLSTVKDLWDKIVGTTQTGMGNVSQVVATDWDGINSEIQEGGSTLNGTVSNVWSSVANTTGGWLQSMLEAVSNWVKEVIAQLLAVKAAGSSSGWGGWLAGLFGGEGGGASTGGSAGIDAGVDAGSSFHKGGFIPRYHVGGGLRSDEKIIIGKSGEYMLSKEDVDFVNKVKNNGPTINMNIGGGAAMKPTIFPLGVQVMINNSSSAALQGSGSMRTAGDANFVIDVVLKDINTRGRLAQLGR